MSLKYSMAANRRCSSCSLVSFGGIQGMVHIKLKLQESVASRNDNHKMGVKCPGLNLFLLDFTEIKLS